jgi:hypothetical protein
MMKREHGGFLGFGNANRTLNCHCEPTASANALPDDRLREAIQFAGQAVHIPLYQQRSNLNLFDFQSLFGFDSVPVSQSRNFTDMNLSGLHRSD